MSDLPDQLTEEDLYELMEDDFDAAKFYRALSNALVQLENYDEQVA